MANTTPPITAPNHFPSNPLLALLGVLPKVSPAITAVVIVFAGTNVVLTLTVPEGPYNPGIAVMFSSGAEEFELFEPFEEEEEEVGW
jgi:hypothetical protein